MIDQLDSVTKEMSQLQQAHQRLKAIRIEYEAVHAAGRYSDWNQMRTHLLLRERYSKALEEFFLGSSGRAAE